MSSLDDALAKIPKPILVLGVLALALGLIVYQNPLSDGCEVEITNFTREVTGLLTDYKTSKAKTQFAQINFLRDQCRQGNSQGVCVDYFKAIKRIADAVRASSNKCYPALQEDYPKLIGVLADGVKIMALAAWGEQPPDGIAQRLSWLTEGDIYAFCRSKNKLIELTSQEDFKSLRQATYSEFPDRWPDSVPLAKRAEIPRPRALKSPSNPSGSLDEPGVYERSLFSLRCDLYQ